MRKNIVFQRGYELALSKEGESPGEGNDPMWLPKVAPLMGAARIAVVGAKSAPAVIAVGELRSSDLLPNKDVYILKLGVGLVPSSWTCCTSTGEAPVFFGSQQCLFYQTEDDTTASVIRLISFSFCEANASSSINLQEYFTCRIDCVKQVCLWEKHSIRGEGGRSCFNAPRNITGFSLCPFDSKGDVIILFGGQNKRGCFTNDMYCLHARRNIWQKINTRDDDPREKMPSPRSGHTCTKIGRSFVVFGGITTNANGRVLNDVHVCTLRTQFRDQQIAIEYCVCEAPRVSGCSPLPTVGHSALSVGSNLFIFGGEVPKSSRKDAFYILDCVTWVWSFLPSATIGRRILPGTACDGNGRIIVFGGLGAGRRRSKRNWVSVDDKLSDLPCFSCYTCVNVLQLCLC